MMKYSRKLFGLGKPHIDFQQGGGVRFVSVTDIDPFLLNLFQGKQAIAEPLVIAATIQATISNSFLKAIYGVTLGAPAMRRYLWVRFGAIIVASFIVLLLV